MNRVVWDAYEEFRCIAEKCPDSCCKGWIVDVDDASADYYRSLEGPLGDRLRQVLKTEDGASFMELENDRCPMWREDKLCQIQAQLGHDALCKVCREYPRLIMDYGDFAEWGVELSCPEAARLIFRGITAKTQSVPNAEPAEYDREWMELLQTGRQRLMEFWAQTELDVPQALAVTLLYAYCLQQTPEGESAPPVDAEHLLQTARSCVGTVQLQPMLDFFLQQEILTREWEDRLRRPDPGSWDPRLRHLAQYLIRRYWLQSVWDYDLTSRAKFIVAACILVNSLGGDPVRTAQLFAKEIENDPDNRDAILDAAYSHPAFTDANLLGLLLK